MRQPDKLTAYYFVRCIKQILCTLTIKCKNFFTTQAKTGLPHLPRKAVSEDE